MNALRIALRDGNYGTAGVILVPVTVFSGLVTAFAANLAAMV